MIKVLNYGERALGFLFICNPLFLALHLLGQQPVFVVQLDGAEEGNADLFAFTEMCPVPFIQLFIEVQVRGFLCFTLCRLASVPGSIKNIPR